MRIRRFRIANPRGFQSDFLTVERGEVELRPESLRRRTVVLPEIVLEGVRIRLERSDDGRANYEALLGGLKRVRLPKGSRSWRLRKKFVVKTLVIRRIEAKVRMYPGLGTIAEFDVEIPEIRLENVSSHSDGASVMAEVTDALTNAVLIEVAKRTVSLPFRLLLAPVTIAESIGGLLTGDGD